MKALVADFPFVSRQHVRFSDCDPLGHANNASYSSYLEEARIGMLGDLGDFILARVEIDFRAPLRAGAEIEILSRCTRVGTKSFELEHEIREGAVVVAEGKSVLVAYDYEREASVPVPVKLRERLLASG